MITVILPGYSAHNKEWAEDIAKTLKENSLPTVVHEWRHWSTDKNFNLNYEIKEIEKFIGDEKVNVIAKSVGVYVALNLIPRIIGQVNKVIFCGIASVEGAKRKELLEKVLTVISPSDVLCIQNENDKFVKFPDAQKFYHSVEPKLKVVSKPRSDHDYPYPTDFLDFIK